MSIATDRVDFARSPTRWQIGPLVGAGLTLAALILCLFFGIFLWARHQLHLSLPQLQTLVFVLLVFAGQGTVYLVRERGHFWHSRPSRWLLVSSAADVLIVSLLATNGVLMAAISPILVVETLVLIILYLAAVDLLKVSVFQYFGLADPLRTEVH
jgi:H+-transporting ATPase